jgi:rRNA small subunit pseudouridine methyltransferase Nep1
LLTLVLAECALETIPRRLWKHPLIGHHAKKRNKAAQFILLDRSYHHAAMKRLDDSEKTGRPDIIHLSLLEALGSPLNKEGLLEVYVHTLNDYVISMNAEVRLPKNYNRFVGLFEQLFQLGTIPTSGPALLRLDRKPLAQLLEEINPDYVLLFSRQGAPKTVEAAMSTLQTKQRPAAVIGGFPHGHFSKTTISLADEVACADPEMLETWTLTARVIYEYERALSLPQKRLSE